MRIELNFAMWPAPRRYCFRYGGLNFRSARFLAGREVACKRFVCNLEHREGERQPVCRRAAQSAESERAMLFEGWHASAGATGRYAHAGTSVAMAWARALTGLCTRKNVEHL